MRLIQFDESHWLVGLGILVCLLLVMWRQGRRLPYLLLFSGFWVYLLVVVSHVVFPIVIDPNPNEAGFVPGINLFPFHFGACSRPRGCLEEVFQNILLTVPFGFGINFLLSVKSRWFLWLAPAIGLVLELAQLTVTMAFRSPFHVFDINDIISNSLGVLIGYAIFRVSAWGYLKTAGRYDFEHKWFLEDVYAVASRAQGSESSKKA